MKRILGIGNALVDILVHVDGDDIINRFGLAKGGMEMVGIEKKNEILEAIADLDRTVATGGSTSNTMHGLARLGNAAGYMGSIGRDPLGATFRDECMRFGVEPHLLESDTETGVAITFITPDAERTFATFLGAAATMQPSQIDKSVFDSYDIVHVEGYLIFNHELILEICRAAKDKGLMVSMDMASYNLVEQHREFVETLLRDYVDIIFANEDEARTFTGKEPEEALDVLSKHCPISVVKVGKDGSMVMADGCLTRVEPVKAEPVDTTGAGDIYASGFLYGLSKGYDFARSGKIASMLAAKLIECVGAKLPDNVWESLVISNL
ncbi:MAG: adenosine kinase [Bacteroidales bacterium]|nr:adenosine kinase [Bacteroidales bacterium]